MPAWVAPAIISGISALGGLFGNRRSQQQQFQRSNQRNEFTNQGNATNYNRTTPTYDPAAWDFRNELMGRALNRSPLLDPRSAAASVTTNQLQNLNNQSALQRRVVDNMMRQRGLSHSPMGGAMLGNFDSGRVAQGVNILNQQPILERQFFQENENMENARQQLAQQLFNMIPYSQEGEGFQNTWNTGVQTGESQSQGTSTIPGNMLGGGISSLATTLAGLYGAGAFGGQSANRGTMLSLPNQPWNGGMNYLNPSGWGAGYGGGINPNYQLPRFGLGG